jgi:hypothetical protein
MIRSLALIAFLLGSFAFGMAQERPRPDLANLVETLVHTYGPFDLKASTLRQVPATMAMTVPEDMWLVGYHIQIVDGVGTGIGAGVSVPHVSRDEHAPAPLARKRHRHLL